MVVERGDGRWEGRGKERGIIKRKVAPKKCYLFLFCMGFSYKKKIVVGLI